MNRFTFILFVLAVSYTTSARAESIDESIPVEEPITTINTTPLQEPGPAVEHIDAPAPKPEPKPIPKPKPRPEPRPEPPPKEKVIRLDEVNVEESDIKKLTLPESDADSSLWFWSLLNRIEIGTRFTHYSLKSDRREFLGSIDYLEAQQNNAPTKLFVDFMIMEYLGLELTWDSIEAATITSSDEHNDGNIVMSGPIITAFVRGSFDVDLGRVITFKPYIGAGFAMMSSSFDHEGWWHHGFGDDDWEDAEEDYQDWVSDGSPEWPNNGYERTMTLTDSVGTVVTAGCAINITENWGLDLYLRMMSISVDDTYTLSSYGTVFRTTEATFDLDNTAYGLGVRYRF